MMNVALWIVQILLAALFLFAGGVKLVTPIEEMLKQMPQPLPGWFLRFTGVIEVLGAIGLIVPWLTGIRPGLTPLAAAGLVIVMIGAVIFTILAGDIAMALMPLVVGLLCAFVAYGRWRLTPHPESAQPSWLQPRAKRT
jgi:uncharacterized membrane protein YphA (DoxX/SURF4 family)